MNPSPGETPLPDLHQACLDGPTVDALFRDLAELCCIHEITAKAGTRDRASQESLTLDQARQGLLLGTYRGVQIRYDFQDETWWDTLVARPDGIRLIRLRLADALPSDL